MGLQTVLNCGIRFLLLATGIGVTCGQDVIGKNQLVLLADSRAAIRDEVIEKIALNGRGQLDILLSWTHSPPTGVDPQRLKIGLVMVFGRIRAKEAIPFLLDNLSIQIGLSRQVIGLKSHAVIATTYPGVKALIEIGPDSLGPIAAHISREGSQEKRLLGVTVISMIGGANSKQILETLRSEAEFELRIID